MSVKNYYEILEIEENATAEELKLSFRKLAKQYHPDANKDDPNADTMFKLINEAYETLSDQSKRIAYDKTIVKYVSKLRAPNTSLDGTGLYIDEYDKIPEKKVLDDGGGDVIINIPILPTEAVTGCNKDIQLERKELCDSCNGSGSKQSGSCQLCRGAGKIKFYIDTAKGVETHARVCKTCLGTGIQVLKECNKCQGHGMVKIQKMLRVPVPQNTRDGLTMIKRGDGNKSRIRSMPPGDLKLVIKIMKLKSK